MQLLKNLYAYVWEGRDNNCNTYVFANSLNDNKHVVVDPGHLLTPSTKEKAIEILMGKMQRDGISPGDIELIIITHCHPDHFESAEALRAQIGSKVAIHKSEMPIYAKYNRNADILLEEGELKLNAKKPLMLNVIHTPGHSPGHISLYWSKEKVLIAGDLIFYRSTGRTDLPGGNMNDMKTSILKLSKLSVEYLLCGHPYGHPGIITGKDEVKENFDYLINNAVK